jgi:hypothetical protein
MMRRIVAAALSAVFIVVPFAIGATDGATDAAAAPAAPAAPAANHVAQHVIVIGTEGLTWSDVSVTGTPTLWRLAGDSALGSLSVKAAPPVSCLDDGWLTLGAGNRADAFDHHGSSCEKSALAVHQDGDGATVAGFAAVYRRNLHRTDDTHLGALADALKSDDECISAAGAAAALGAADAGGHVATYRADPAKAAADKAFLAHCAVTLLSVTPGNVDQVAEAVAGNSPAHTALLIVGLAETQGATAHLHVAIGNGIGFAQGELVSASTRRAPFVQLVDVAPTVAQLRGVAAPKSMIGQPWRPAGGRTANVAQQVKQLSRLDLAAQRQGGAIVPYWVTLVALMLASCGFAAWAAWTLGRGGRMVRASRVVALAGAWCALLPVTGFVVGVAPWWSAGHPLLALGLSAVGFATVGLAIAVGLERTVWHGRPFGLAAAVGTLTFAVVALDLVTGAHLQIFTMPGYSPLVAGRFAGIGNVGFGVFAAGALLAAAGWSAVGSPKLEMQPTPTPQPQPQSAQRARWLKRWPGSACLAIGVVAVVADGAPSFGSDVGGVLALVPAFVALAWMLTGVTISWRRALVGAGLTLAVIVVFALVDYARPSSDQTHLGRFVGDVVHGGAWTILRRKALADVHLLGYSVLTLLIPLMVAVAIWLLRMPSKSLRRAFAASPVLRPVLISLVVMAIVGAVLNDSGIVIPALAVLVVLPATMTAVVAAPVHPRRGDPVAGEPDQPSSGRLR